VKLLTVDVERPLPDIAAPSTGEQWVLVRLHGEPLGMLKFSTDGCTSAELAALIAEKFVKPVMRHLGADRDLWGGTGQLHDHCPRRGDFNRPSVTVAVCTRNGVGRIAECLDALVRLQYTGELLELLVIDNAPPDDATRKLVASRYPRIRYVHEPRPGLNWARNRAILEARGEIIAYTDDDVSVDPGWVDAIARIFAAEPEVDAVTGLVVPDEMDVEPQRLFEAYGGFGRGFERRYFRVNTQAGVLASPLYGGTGQFGTGANMAFRRSAFDRVGMFDPALDVGTPTNGGGDLDLFFRVLKAGRILVYEPAATVRHRHRRIYEQLHTQLANNGIGFYAYLVRSAQAYRDERSAVIRLGIYWFFWWNVRRLLLSFIRPSAFPRDLILAELRGCFTGVRSYRRSKNVAEDVRRTFGPQLAEGNAS
jgi:glycosyltransferase involved in cell wall biosynthesis